jgi:hypothetical protein
MTAMSSEEEHAAETERRTKRNERLETGVMVFQGALALLAVSGIIWWATGHYVLVPAWLTIVALQAVTAIYAQRTIRLLRRANREAYGHVRLLQEQLRHALSIRRD